MSARLFIAAAVIASLTGCGGGAGKEPDMSAPSAQASMTVGSPDFAEGAPIPARFTCDGEDISPALRWTGVPSGAAALALVVDDPDAPGGTFTHWVVVDIDPSVASVATGSAPPGVQIRNSAGKAAYMGPCPPSGTHHYRFTVYALSRQLGLSRSASLSDALKAISEAATAQGRLTGTFSRG